MKSAVEEQLMNGIVEQLGGRRIDQMLPDRSALQADYIFPDHRTIIELKTLEVDKVSEPSFITKISALYERARLAGATDAIVFGTVAMSSEQFNDDYKRLIQDMFQAPIERVVRKAASQIAASATALSIARPIGVLMLVNTKHTAINPGHIPYLLRDIFGPDKYPEIHEVFYVTLDLPAKTGDGYEFDTWFRFKRSAYEPVSTVLEKRIRRAWLARDTKLRLDFVTPSGYGRLFAARNVRR